VQPDWRQRVRSNSLYMMENSNSRNIPILPLVAAGSILLLLLLSVKHPYLFVETNVLGLFVLVVAALIASQYETHFWTILIGVFFWAGSSFPLAGGMNIFRWVMLGLAALLGLAYYARMANRIAFNYLHLLGLFVVIAAFASTLVSVNSALTALKALSLAALFLYASVGARAQWAGNPEPFVRRLVLLAEGVVYLTALCYAASFEVWGNSNSLGLMMGCLCWPILLWRYLLPASRLGVPRRVVPLILCGALLVASLSRASIIAAFLTSMFLLVGSRRYRTLLLGSGLFITVLLNVALVAPERFQSATDTFLYKKGEVGNVMDSRQKPWERSLRTFRDHPWLGLGFGAADNSAEWHANYVTVSSQTRERGSSYLTILETTGLIGALPCALLILALVREIWRIFSWLRRSGNVNQPAVIAAVIILAGLINAFFEDWLLAVGYYMSVIFWVLAFSLRDWMACPVWPEEQHATESHAVDVQRSFAVRGA
jgi:O-antigen ligase